jgi:hypothetical protein
MEEGLGSRKILLETLPAKQVSSSENLTAIARYLRKSRDSFSVDCWSNTGDSLRRAD